MIRIILSAILLLIFPIHVWSEDELKGSFTCKAKYQKVIEMIEGKHKEFGQYTKGVRLNEKFNINYVYSKNENLFSVNAKKLSANSFISDFDVTAKTKTFDGTFFNHEIKKFGAFSHLFLNADDIDLTHSNIILSLSRYYKNDWSGFFIDADQKDTTWLMALDCRHTTDKFDEIFADLRSKDFMD